MAFLPSYNMNIIREICFMMDKGKISLIATIVVDASSRIYCYTSDLTSTLPRFIYHSIDRLSTMVEKGWERPFRRCEIMPCGAAQMVYPFLEEGIDAYARSRG